MHWCVVSLLSSLPAGGANCILGSFLMHDLLGQPLLPWLLSAVCVLGGLLVAGMVLEVPRMKRVKEVSSCCGAMSAGAHRKDEQ
jgi:hypothetical protein